MVGSSPVAPGRIFVSYRRAESGWPTALYERLADHFGREDIVRDIDSIEPGDDFVEVINRAVASCDVMLVVIGPSWISIKDNAGRRRLDLPDDFVRREIEAALQRDKRVIPILVDGATMPGNEQLPPSLVKLSRRHALELSPQRFQYDTDRLLRGLDKIVSQEKKRGSESGLAKPASTDSTAVDQEAVDEEQRPIARPQVQSGRAVWSVLWALLPLLSLGILIPAPFIHAAIRLRTRPQWLFATLYVAICVVALVAMLESREPSFWVVLMVIATVHAFVLRSRVFSPIAGTTSATDESTTKTPVVSAVPHFGVVALGIAGSGKTVYLSSMFHTMNVPTLGRSYFLETGASHRIRLSKVFEELSDTSEDWPRGTRTGETRQFDFDCVSFDEGVKHLLFKISYLDYAGELLESEQEAGSTALNDLEERIRTAHGLLGMLDGYRVLQFLRNEPAGRRYFRSSIQPMIGIMAAASCPIHFVLTKWDLIRSFGEPTDADDNLRLSLVKDALMETTQLKAIVETRSWWGRVIRLIPVSAVGPGFAQLDQDGRVVKRPGGEVHPTNIEVPLTAILPDLFRQVELSLDPHIRQQLAAEAQSRGSRFSMQRFLRLPAGAALRQRLQDVIGGSAGQEVVGMFLDWMAGVSPEESQATRTARRKGRQVAASVEAAQARVMTEFAEQLRGLEERLPASRLSGQ